jgi:phage repressor protein C with HTH and peptisase S24 domain
VHRVRIEIRLAFRRDGLRRATSMVEISEDCCYLAKITGDSMEPTLVNGAVVLVSRWYPPKRGSDEPIIQNGAMYMIQDDGDGRADNRLTLDENSKQLLVTSDNPTYPPYTIPLEDRDLLHIILGRVI